MKKIAALFTALIVAVSLFASVSFAASDLKLQVNGKSVEFQFGEPFIEDGRSLVPLRDLLVELGVPNDEEHIVWDNKEQSVTATKGDKTVKLSVGAKQIFLNGQKISTLEVPATNKDGRVYLPARAVAEAFGYYVGFDSDTSTILVQNEPFEDGGNADGAIKNVKLALQTYADGTTLSAESEKALAAHQKDFFAANRSPLSLKSIAKAVSEKDIAKNVSAYYGTVVRLTFVEIDSVREVTLSDGTVLTGAIGHTGGKYNEMTKSWENSTYFQIFFLGKSDIGKGDKANVHGIPAGETTIELTNALGKTSTEPMYAIVAGNFLKNSTEYDLEVEQSKGGSVAIPELNAEARKKLDRLQVKLGPDGLNIFDPYLNGFEIKSAKIQDYEFKPTTKTTIPDLSYNGLTIPLDSFKDEKSSPFAEQSGSFFVVISTNIGDTTRLVDFVNSSGVSGEEILKELNKEPLEGASFEQGNLVLQFGTEYEFTITKVAISDYSYTPTTPIKVTKSSRKVEIPVASLKLSYGPSLETFLQDEFSNVFGITITTNYGDITKSVSES